MGIILDKLKLTTTVTIVNGIIKAIYVDHGTAEGMNDMLNTLCRTTQQLSV
jgi:hypothetical protein